MEDSFRTIVELIIPHVANADIVRLAQCSDECYELVMRHLARTAPDSIRFSHMGIIRKIPLNKGYRTHPAHFAAVPRHSAWLLCAEDEDGMFYDIDTILDCVIMPSDIKYWDCADKDSIPAEQYRVEMTPAQPDSDERFTSDTAFNIRYAYRYLWIEWARQCRGDDRALAWLVELCTKTLDAFPIIEDMSVAIFWSLPSCVRAYTDIEAVAANTTLMNNALDAYCLLITAAVYDYRNQFEAIAAAAAQRFGAEMIELVRAGLMLSRAHYPWTIDVLDRLSPNNARYIISCPSPIEPFDARRR